MTKRPVTKRLSFHTAHSFIELNESGDGLYLGASPIPVFALVRVNLDQAIQIRSMLDEWIRAERYRQNPKCPIIYHHIECDCQGAAGDR